MMTPETETPELVQIGRSRRDFLSKGTLAAISATLAQACGGPLAYGPGTTPGGTVSGTFKLSDYPGAATVGSIVKLNTTPPVALVHVSQNVYAAYSMVCPHAGTTININGDFSGFTCPNHGAKFAADGTWTGGQTTNSLTALSVTYDQAAGTVTLGNPVTQTPAAIGLAPTTESFAATQGGSNPAAQTVAVTNTGGGTLAGLSVSPVAYAAGQPTGWLGTPTLSGTTAPATLTLQPVTGTLAPGIYTATVSLASTDSSISPASVAVTFTVAAATAAPAITLGTAAATFAAVQGGANPANQTINITNTGGGTLSGLSAAVSGTTSAWLTASVSPATAPATLTLSANVAGLTPATYTGTVTVSSTVAGVTAKTVSVTLTVSAATAPPTIVLSATTKAFSGNVGGTDPAPGTINVQNGGGGSLSGLATAVAYGAGGTGWLTASVSPTTAPSVLTLTPTLGSLAAGTYTATVTVSATGVTAATVTVTFTVAGAAALALSATTITFSSQAGANPAQQQVQATNSGGGTISGLATSIAYGAGATGWLTATLSTTTAPAAITLAATAGTLAVGSYTATVTVSATGQTSKTIAVTYTIAAAGLAVVIANYPALANVGGVAGSVGTVQGTPTAVVRTGANTFAAYSMKCPHQGTTVQLANFKSSGSTFHCPNHDAIFDASGVSMCTSANSNTYGCQITSNLPARTVSYTAGATTLYVS